MQNSLSREQIRFLLVQKGVCSLSENSLSREQIRCLLVSKRGLFFKVRFRRLEGRFVFFWFKKGTVL